MNYTMRPQQKSLVVYSTILLLFITTLKTKFTQRFAIKANTILSIKTMLRREKRVTVASVQKMKYYCVKDVI